MFCVTDYIFIVLLSVQITMLSASAKAYLLISKEVAPGDGAFVYLKSNLVDLGYADDVLEAQPGMNWYLEKTNSGYVISNSRNNHLGSITNSGTSAKYMNGTHLVNIKLHSSQVNTAFRALLIKYSIVKTISGSPYALTLQSNQSVVWSTLTGSTAQRWGGSINQGDVDFDDKVTAADSRLVLRAASKLESFDELQKDVADVDRDGAVTSADARLILRWAANLE